jgi:cytosine/adenosine deaminase-related metal-dependent hydrolase
MSTARRTPTSRTPATAQLARSLPRLMGWVVLLISPALAQTPAQHSNEFLIRNVRIFDGARVISRGEVWIQGGRIKAVGAEVKAPVGIRTIDGTGDTLLPGLIDAHAHVFLNALKEALAFGVTTELDMFMDYHYAQQVKNEQAQGKDLDLADLLSAGTLVTAPYGHGTEYGHSYSHPHFA